MHCVLLASEDRGGKKHIKEWNEGEEAEAPVMRRNRERAMTAV